MKPKVEDVSDKWKIPEEGYNEEIEEEIFLDSK